MPPFSNNHSSANYFNNGLNNYSNTNNMNYGFDSQQYGQQYENHDNDFSDDETATIDSIETDPDIQKFRIVLCELFNPSIHGMDNDSDPTICGQYLVYNKYDYILPAELLSGYDSDGVYWDESWFQDNPPFNEDLIAFRDHIRQDILPDERFHNHPIIRNYKNIITAPDYIRPEIAKIEYLSGRECVAILKTHWLRLVQRTWKRVFADRKKCMRLRCSPQSLRTRELRGIWPHECRVLPQLKGMLSCIAHDSIPQV
jgi:hypothetical protein